VSGRKCRRTWAAADCEWRAILLRLSCKTRYRWMATLRSISRLGRSFRSGSRYRSAFQNRAGRHRERSRGRPRRGPPGAARARGAHFSSVDWTISWTSRRSERSSSVCRRRAVGALEHDAHRRQNLAEIVVQLARNRPEGALLHPDELARELAAALRESRHTVEPFSGCIGQVQGRETIRMSISATNR